ncbi:MULTISPECIES: pyridoxal phosphate-dependent decarboxylase family protein [Sphingomonas]|uniref:pyridoxal phosphate-dependent decarboxylase family protein n=1 Tax=Sphingomonas TaxID=13687 RepID=UPI00082C53C4|nr:pyridoxal-dependent decarboxylase [Sphingomonas pituitosa]
MSVEDGRNALAVAYRAAEHWLASVADRSIGTTSSMAELRERLGRPLADLGVPAAKVIDELVQDTDGGLLGSGSGRFFGWVIGGTLPSALAADWLVSAWDQNAAIHACSPAEAIIEEVTGEWLKELFGLPEEASFAFVTGTQAAHVTCLAAARHRLLDRAGWNVEVDGLVGAPSLRVLTGSERHGSVDRAVRMLGLGTHCMETLPCDSQGRIVPEALDDALSRSAMPTIVVLQAGDLNIGAFDPFAELVPIAKRHGAWVHVDGAFGLWVQACPTYRHLAAGIELADSWTNDGHKWLNTPFDCGYAIVRDAQAHRAAFSFEASYAQSSNSARDQIEWNPEWSRRGRALPTYAALRELGRDGVSKLIARSCDHARALVAGIGALPGARVEWLPTINQGLVRFLDPAANSGSADHDRRTDEVIARVAAAGVAFFSGTTWRGMRCMRVSVCNWRTDAQDVELTVDAVRQALSHVVRQALSDVDSA